MFGSFCRKLVWHDTLKCIHVIQKRSANSISQFRFALLSFCSLYPLGKPINFFHRSAVLEHIK